MAKQRNQVLETRVHIQKENELVRHPLREIGKLIKYNPKTGKDKFGNKWYWGERVFTDVDGKTRRTAVMVTPEGQELIRLIKPRKPTEEFKGMLQRQGIKETATKGVENFPSKSGVLSHIDYLITQLDTPDESGNLPRSAETEDKRWRLEALDAFYNGAQSQVYILTISTVEHGEIKLVVKRRKRDSEYKNRKNLTQPYFYEALLTQIVPMKIRERIKREIFFKKIRMRLRRALGKSVNDDIVKESCNIRFAKIYFATSDILVQEYVEHLRKPELLDDSLVLRYARRIEDELPFLHRLSPDFRYQQQDLVNYRHEPPIIKHTNIGYDDETQTMVIVDGFMRSLS